MTYRELRSILNVELTEDMLDSDVTIGMGGGSDGYEYFPITDFTLDCQALDEDAPFDPQYPQPAIYFEA